MKVFIDIFKSYKNFVKLNEIVSNSHITRSKSSLKRYGRKDLKTLIKLFI